jgi:drug/metabolite transporter (DMT)-like permease
MVWIALGIVYVVWGSTYLGIAIVVQTLPPLLAAGIRFAVAGGLLALWMVVRRRAALRVESRQLVGAAIVGALLLAGGNGFLMTAERSVPSGLAALIIASVPLWIVLLRVATGDRVHRDVIVGVLVGLVGVAVLVVPGGLSGAIDPWGLLAVIGSALSWSLGTFLSTRLRMPRNTLASTTYQMLAAGAILFALALPVGDHAPVAPDGVSTASLIALAYLIAFGSIVGFSAYTWLLQHAPVSVVATYAYVNPVIAVLLGATVLHEPVTPTMIGGAALILAAVAFIVSRATAKPQAKQQDRRPPRSGGRPPTREATVPARATGGRVAARSPSARD